MAKKLTRAEVEQFREILIEERNRLLANVKASDRIISHADGEFDGGAGRSHSNHMADQGSDEFEYETQLLLSAGQRATLREIDAALQRIEDGVYGICEVTGNPIARPRLRAMPTARLCIEAQEEEDARLGR